MQAWSIMARTKNEETMKRKREEILSQPYETKFSGEKNTHNVKIRLISKL